MDRRKNSTDPRATVLESVATNPLATREVVYADCVGPRLDQSTVSKVVWNLQRDGLIGSDGERLFVTRSGLAWLSQPNKERRHGVERSRKS